MATPALQQTQHHRTATRQSAADRPELYLVKRTSRPAPAEAPTHPLRDYSLLSGAGFAVALVLVLLVPAAERLQAFTAFTAAASLALFAAAPFARRNWQRLVNFTAAVTVAVLSLLALQSTAAGHLSLAALAAAALAQLQFSSEHNWRAPGPAWLLFFTSLSLLWLA